jgi:hypothetical protein
MTWVKEHKLLFGLLILAIVGTVWYGLSSRAAPEPLLESDATDSEILGGGGDQELVGSLLELRAVTLSGTILNDTAFTSLQDFGTTIVAEPVGRTNPFAPLGGAQQGATIRTTGETAR